MVVVFALWRRRRSIFAEDTLACTSPHPPPSFGYCMSSCCSLVPLDHSVRTEPFLHFSFIGAYPLARLPALVVVVVVVQYVLLLGSSDRFCSYSTSQPRRVVRSAVKFWFTGRSIITWAAAAAQEKKSCKTLLHMY